MAPKTGMCGNPEWSPDGTRICYTFATPTTVGDLHVVSVTGGEVKQLTFSAQMGNLERMLVSPDKITYKSTDGFSIPAYLYKPAALRPGERYPGIIWIHGGPTSQFSDSLQPDVQFFVQQGYVCLLPNIRGSSGYGREFEDANNKCWGECDLKDVLAGVEYLKTLPYVDPDAMGITGTSYGGIMSMAAVAFAPGTFQAAIPCSGYCDYIRSVEESELRHGKLWDYEMGPWKENEALYRRLSPYYHVENVTTPTLVICGEGRYPGSPQSRYFAEQLEKYYKIYKYVAYPDEMYYVRRHVPEMRLEMLRWFDRFLKKSNIVAK
ncbi:MAG: S9 family peptidase [Acidobacteria bacterium]|nr:S9 family peptidase [Acidobacteriota bacterium]